MRKAALLALVLACHAATYAPTSTPAPTIGHPLRLVGGGSEREGRVEILHDGQWGTVCDDDWDLDDANVVCQQLFGVGALEAKGEAFFGEGTGPILMDEVRCTGNEAALWLCPFYGDQDDDDYDDDDDDDDDWRRRRLQGAWGSHDCDHDEDAGVICEQSSAPTSTPAPTPVPTAAPTYAPTSTPAPTPKFLFAAGAARGRRRRRPLRDDGPLQPARAPNEARER